MNNFMAEKEQSLSLGEGGSEKENTSLLKNVITSGEEEDGESSSTGNQEKIIGMLNGLNFKMTQFKE